ncbi:MAG: DUF222 domain-containing protein [Pseudonocardiaceae bacterium]
MAAPVADEVHAAGDAQWLARLRAAEIESRMAQARVLQIIGERHAIGVAGRSGYGTVARMVAAVALIGAGKARNRVAAAEALTPRQSLTGEMLPARCPATAAAFAGGENSASAVRIVTDAMRRIPAGVHPQTEAETEQALTDHARRFEPRPLAQITHRVLAHLDPDGPAPIEEATVTCLATGRTPPVLLTMSACHHHQPTTGSDHCRGSRRSLDGQVSLPQRTLAAMLGVQRPH